jgi:hypothetical protein
MDVYGMCISYGAGGLGSLSYPETPFVRFVMTSSIEADTAESSD